MGITNWPDAITSMCLIIVLGAVAISIFYFAWKA